MPFFKETDTIKRPHALSRDRTAGKRRSPLLKKPSSFLTRRALGTTVGVIIGAAFSGIVDSMVKDVITPIIGFVGGQPDFSAIKVGPVALGNFINAVISFLIKAAVIYFLVVEALLGTYSSFISTLETRRSSPVARGQDLMRNS
jgi:large conductance mechanosensitive channel protein